MEDHEQRVRARRIVIGWEVDGVPLAIEGDGRGVTAIDDLSPRKGKRVCPLEGEVHESSRPLSPRGSLAPESVFNALGDVDLIRETPNRARW